jgi:hypothetical protein
MNFGVERTRPRYSIWQFLIPSAFLLCVFVLIVAWLLFQHPYLTPQKNWAVRVLLALIGAAFGAMVFLRSRALLQASAALALFLVVFLGYRYQPPTISQPPDLVKSPVSSDWHDTDPQGQSYTIVWEADPACLHVGSDATHRCSFEHAQVSFPGDNTPYDRWNLLLEAPGPVYDVLCEPLGTHEFNEVKGDARGQGESNIARCSGWINGGDGPIRMTVKYRQRW